MTTSLGYCAASPTTWALVTIRFGATAKPLPWPKSTTSPSSKAITTTRTTLRPATEISSALAEEVSASAISSARRNRASITAFSIWRAVTGLEESSSTILANNPATLPNASHRSQERIGVHVDRYSHAARQIDLRQPVADDVLDRHRTG